MYALVAAPALLGETVRIKLTAKAQVVAMLEVWPQCLVELRVVQLYVKTVSAVRPTDDIGMRLGRRIHEFVQKRRESSLLRGKRHPTIVVGLVDRLIVSGRPLLLVQEAISASLAALDLSELT